jgi:hypothetical protein
MIISGKHLRRKQMVIKVDKSEEFKKSGKKLISEYDADKWLDKIEKNDERELFEMKRKREYLDEWSKFRKDG